jgi:uridine phosphorylase
VDTTAVHFDLAVLCFRGWTASRMMIEALGATELEAPVLYGSKCYQVTIGGLDVAVVPYVIWGGPATAILLEELACLGVRTAIGFGAAGSLVSEAHMGQMFVVRQALVRDGTSREYTDRAWIGPDRVLFDLAQKLWAGEGVEPLQAVVWTTDALYQERPSKIRLWREAGADLVCLEATPFHAVAAALGIRAVYLGLVTDHLSKEQGWQPDFWSRENTTDPVIARITRKLIEAINVGGEHV